jgi:regulatory protein spx
VEINYREFFKEPLSREEIKDLLQGRPAAEAFAFRSPAFKKMGLERDRLTDARLIDLMAKEPSLIRRPVVQIGKKIYFGATAAVLVDLLKSE